METMKRKWGKPVTKLQVFTPNEFVAVCYEIEASRFEDNGLPGLQLQRVTIKAENDTSVFGPYLQDAIDKGAVYTIHHDYLGNIESYEIKMDKQITGSWTPVQTSKPYTMFGATSWYPTYATGSSGPEWAELDVVGPADVTPGIYYVNSAGTQIRKDPNNPS